MKNRLLALLLIFFVNTSVFSAEPFRAGTAEIEITPPVGYRMSGYFYERFSEGVKNPLKAKAIVFEQGDTKGSILFCDLIGISLDVSERTRNKLQKELSIPAENISVTATHTHTGPLYFGALREHFHKTTIDKEGKDIHEEINYPDYLVEQLSKVVKQAHDQLQEVNISAGFGFEDRIAFNRRFVMKDGKAKTWIGIKHPDVVRVAGPIDTEVGLVRFDSVKNNQPVSMITSYALHLDTVGGTHYAADFPYYLSQNLKDKFGPGFVSLFGAGTCGDINHVNTAKKERNKTEVIGNYLTESVAEALPKLQKSSSPSLAIKHAYTGASKQEYTTSEIEEAEKNMNRMNDSKFNFYKKVKSRSIVEIQQYPEKTIPFEVHAFRLSPDVAIVTLPGEVFVELGMQIKQESPFETTLVIELANDCPGYIPTEKAFVEGGYETVNTRVVPGSGEKMARTAIQLLAELKSE